MNYTYRSGEEPKVGDRVEFDPENELHLRRRPRGDGGTVYELGKDLIDPMPAVVFVAWDRELPWPDDDCYVKLLRKAAS